MDQPGKGAALESQPRIAELMGVLKSGAVDAKLQACVELGKFGLDARGERKALIDVARNDSNAQVRQAATAVIRNIEAVYRKHGVRILDPFTPSSPAVDKAAPQAKPPSS